MVTCITQNGQTFITAKLRILAKHEVKNSKNENATALKHLPRREFLSPFAQMMPFSDVR